MDEFWKLELLIDAIDQTILDWVMVLVCVFLAMVHDCIIHIIHMEEEFNNGLYALSFITDYQKDKEGMFSVGQTFHMCDHLILKISMELFCGKLLLCYLFPYESDDSGSGSVKPFYLLGFEGCSNGVQ